MAKVIIDADTEEPVDPQIGYVDGYNFGDTLLEGVMFEITLDENRKAVCKGVVSSSKAYMKKFVQAQIDEWCQQALQTAEECLTDLSGRRDLWLDEVP